MDNNQGVIFQNYVRSETYDPIIKIYKVLGMVMTFKAEEPF